jgi:hypothetical protein
MRSKKGATPGLSSIVSVSLEAAVAAWGALRSRVVAMSSYTVRGFVSRASQRFTAHPNRAGHARLSSSFWRSTARPLALRARAVSSLSAVVRLSIIAGRCPLPPFPRSLLSLLLGAGWPICCGCSFFTGESSCVAQNSESKKEEFRKYLERAGVIDALTKGRPPQPLAPSRRNAARHGRARSLPAGQRMLVG